MSENSQPTTAPSDTPEPAGQSTPASEPIPAAAGVEEQLTIAKKEAAVNFDRYMRAVADMENFRKRTMREKDELRQFATANVMEDLIPVLDNLALGLSAAKQQTDVKSVADGIGLVLEQLKATLIKHGMKEVNPQGQPFDHNLHECIAHLPSSEVPAETVSQVVRLGYILNGRLLRPASVVVSSGQAKATEAEG